MLNTKGQSQIDLMKLQMNLAKYLKMKLKKLQFLYYRNYKNVIIVISAKSF